MRITCQLVPIEIKRVRSRNVNQQKGLDLDVEDVGLRLDDNADKGKSIIFGENM